VVQKTGWGKGSVYFIAAKLLREQGLGPSFLISPLLSLMRNQIANVSPRAERRVPRGLRTLNINRRHGCIG
jgi:superfamily II DNA helicase RecQ